MIAVKFNEFLDDELTDVKSVNLKTKIGIQTLYNARKSGRMKPDNVKKIIKSFPNFKNYIFKKVGVK